ncbi:hypothetical protein BDZ91DRAFT_803722 [Kalaharituber pfeilii]|nr:hypothetical protein BDZ91DRAFT_803722 [Kalaharituber pfeilii]
MRVEHAIEEAVARGEVKDGEDYTVTEREISIQDIERGEVNIQQIIDFIERSKALDTRKPEDQIYETRGSKQPTVEDEDSDQESTTPETPQELRDRGDSCGYTQPTSIRPPTPDSPRTPDIDEREHEENFLFDIYNAAARQARSWVEKMAAGQVKPETAGYMGASTAEALHGLEKRFGLERWEERLTKTSGNGRKEWLRSTGAGRRII